MFTIRVSNPVTSMKMEYHATTEQDCLNWFDSELERKHCPFGVKAKEQLIELNEQMPEGYEFVENRDIQELTYDQDGNVVTEIVTVVDEQIEQPVYTTKTMQLVRKPAEFSYTIEPYVQHPSELIAQYKKFKDFGSDVELYFTGLINNRGYTQVQKDSLQSNDNVLAILNELNFGRIGKAKSMVDALVADDNLFFEEDLQLVSSYMGEFLAGL